MKKHSFSLKKTTSYAWLATAGLALTMFSCQTDSDELNLNGESSNSLSSKSVEIGISKITAEEEQSANPASNAIDNSSKTRWSGFGDPVNLDLDLGTVSFIDYVKIAFYKGDERKNSFKAYTSNDKKSWKLINTKNSSGKTDKLETFDLKNTDARYLRLACGGNSESDWNSILDIEVYGKGGTGSPGTSPTNPVEPEEPEEPSNPTNSKTPGGILGIDNDDWKLNGFTAKPKSGITYYDDVMDQVNGNISTWSNSDYFYASNGWAYFKCYRGFGGSKSSSNPRTELRELKNGNHADWDGKSGTHTMEYDVRVDQLPKSTDGKSGVVCFGQIHGPSKNKDGVKVDDTIRVQFLGKPDQSSGNVKLKISGYVTEDIRGGSLTLSTNYKLDTTYRIKIQYSSSTVKVFVDGKEVFKQKMDTSTEGNYFKVGNYLQSVKSASFTGSYGLVGIKNLKIKH